MFRVALIAALSMLPFVAALPAHALDGSLDPSFGIGGRLVTTRRFQVVPLADGRLVMDVPPASQLERLLPSGDVDTSFGRVGYVSGSSSQQPGMPFLPDAVAFAETSRGRLLVNGGLGGSQVWYQLNEDGSLDTGFGSGGYIRSATNEFMRTIIVRPEGDAIGWTSVPRSNAGTAPLRGASISLTSRGQSTTDSAWGPDLRSVLPDAYAVDQGKLLADGRVLLLVRRFAPLSSTGVVAGGCAMVAVTSAGNIDTSFGSGGVVAISTPPSSQGCSWAVYPDGSSAVASDDSNVITRYSASGGVVSRMGGLGAPVALLPLGDGRLIELIRINDPRPLRFVAISPSNTMDDTFASDVVLPTGPSVQVSLLNRPGGGLLVYTNDFAKSQTELIAVDTVAGSQTEPALVETSRFEPVAPARILDTRDGLGAPAGKVAAGGVIDVVVAGHGGVPPAGATAVVLNVTAANVGGGGFVTVWPTGQSQPNSSNLNYERAGQAAPNLVIVKLGVGGRVSMFTFAAADLIADVAGYFVPATSATNGRFVAAPTPLRVLDTRDGNGHLGPVAAGQSIDVNITGVGGIPTSGVAAVVVNLTATSSLASGFITAWPTGGPTPIVSNLNLDGTGSTRANLAIVRLGDGGRISLFDGPGSDLIADVVGWFTDSSAAPAASGLFVPVRPQRLLDTRLESGPVAPNTSARLFVAGAAVVPPRSSSAVVLNLTATGATASGFVTAFPAGLPLPNASTLNLERTGQTIANLTIARTNGRAVDLYTKSGTHFIADLAGWFTA
jgi:hypothetical protein